MIAMSETTLRHIAMLSLVPGKPGKVTARELHERLKAQGHDIHVRSIERDLQKLSATFPLISDEARPAGWSWEMKGARLTLPCMNLTEALTYELLARYLSAVLPRSMRRHLEPDFLQARRTLDMFQALPVGRWSKRIAVLQSGHQLVPPEVAPEVSDIAYEALLEGKRFEASYRSQSAERPKVYVFNPLGLVYRQGVLYLVATLWDYNDVRQFALHRMSAPSRLDASATPIKGFDFDRYVRDEKSFEYPVGKEIKLELSVAPWLARHLEESRLAANQRVEPIQGSDRFRVIATVAETEQLFWWLCSFGANLEVKQPAALRRKMKQHTEDLARTYG